MFFVPSFFSLLGYDHRRHNSETKLINQCRIFYNNGYKINTEFDGRLFGLARRRNDQRQLDDRAPASLPDVSFRRHDNAKANVTSLGLEFIL